jgi:hypothetical protein
MKALSLLLFLACSRAWGFSAALVRRGLSRTDMSTGMHMSISSINADTLAGLQVKNLDGESVSLDKLIKTNKRTVLACLTHFGDFNAWELTQNLVQDAAQITSAGPDGTQIILVGVGSSSAAKKFASGGA